MNQQRLEERIRKNPKAVQRWFEKNPKQLEIAVKKFPHLFNVQYEVNEDFEEDRELRMEAGKDSNNTDLSTRPSQNITWQEVGSIKEWNQIDRDWWFSRPFPFQLECARSGVWLQHGVGDFFKQQWDKRLPKEKRIAIAEAFAWRADMPFSDPTVEVEIPSGHGMAEDGSQQRVEITKPQKPNTITMRPNEKIEVTKRDRLFIRVKEIKQGMGLDGKQKTEWVYREANPIIEAGPYFVRKKVIEQGMGFDGQQKVSFKYVPLEEA